MPDTESSTRLTIVAQRAGTVGEIAGFLSDLETAYVALYLFDGVWSGPFSRRGRRLPFEFYLQFGLPFGVLGWEAPRIGRPDLILPEHRLTINRVRLESPGFWEFLGSLNPLQQIREYLKDRHERRQDREWREATERDKLRLENDLIQGQVWEKDNAVLRDRVSFLRDLGFSNEEIRQLVWAQVGQPVAALGRHQDTRLIEGAE